MKKNWLVRAQRRHKQHKINKTIGKDIGFEMEYIKESDQYCGCFFYPKTGIAYSGAIWFDAAMDLTTLAWVIIELMNDNKHNKYSRQEFNKHGVRL